MDKLHQYKVRVRWTGNTGTGTSSYDGYERSHLIEADGKESAIAGSSDPAFRGRPERWNPEDLLVGSLSACHKLWYLNLCAVNGIVVTSYSDDAIGVMRETEDGGHFDRVVLRPSITLAPGSDLTLAKTLHEAASKRCFIKNSVNFPVDHDADVRIAAGPDGSANSGNRMSDQ